MNPDNMQSKAQGCLLGLAVGDILGCPLEAMSPATIKEQFGRVDHLVDDHNANTLKNTHFWRLPGLHSDDTQQALSIADILIEFGEIKEDELLALRKKMADTVIMKPSSRTSGFKKNTEGFGVHRGTGPGFRKRLHNLNLFPPPSNGDGAAMRVAPIGFKFCNNQESRISNALKSAYSTSSHPHSMVSACAIACAVSSGMQEILPGPKDFLHLITTETGVAERMLQERHPDRIHKDFTVAIYELSQILEKMQDWLQLPLQQALNNIATQAGELLGASGLFATQSYAITAIPTSEIQTS